MQPVLSSVGKILWFVFTPSLLLLAVLHSEINNSIPKLGLYSIFAILIFFYLKRKHPDIIQEKQRPSIKELLLILLFILVINFVHVILSFILAKFFPIPIPNSDSILLSSWDMFITGVLVVPVTEEIVFRGLILHRMLPVGIAFAFLFNSVVFALPHLYLSTVFLAFLMGLLLSYSAYRYGIQWSFIFHAFTNALSFYLTFVSFRDIEVFIVDGNNMTVAMFIPLILSLIAILGIIYILYMCFKNQTVIKKLWLQYRPLHSQWLEVFKNPWSISYIIVNLLWSISTFFAH